MAVPLVLKRRIRLLQARLTFRKRLGAPSLENVVANGAAISYGYQLWMGNYFENYRTWSQKKTLSSNAEGMSLQHCAMVDFLKNNPLPNDSRFIDVCCGLGHLFVYLKVLLGHSDFTGVEDSSFQPRIMAAAREFLNYYSTPARLVDFCNVAYGPHYSNAGFYGDYDVFSHFGVDTYYFFPIAYRTLKRGGLYIAELEDRSPGVYADCFEVLKVYEGYGRVGDTGLHPRDVVVMRRR